MTGKIFKSKIDTSLIVLFIVAAAVPMVIVGLSIQKPLKVGMAPLIAVAVSFAFAIAMPLWLFRTTSYTIFPDELVVRCGPVRQRVALRDITSIKPTRTLLSAPALSLDRLAISHGGRLPLVISPEDKIGFLNELVQAGVPREIALG